MNANATTKNDGPAPRVLTDEELSQLLRQQQFGVLASVTSTGHPHLSTVLQAAALRARLDLDAIEPGLRETFAGLRREVDGTADPSNGLRSAIAARLADQQAAPPSTA
ncbi:pyridoxamine 5'-phosphate oxidase family protein [Streptomyces sp. ISL-96]|uniref:pyridoxamine 5'-phosphate oxidase family protein n=1 Tax=Streptomyces sp. ISL-96 TaxID=2819191 RepID=UPI001BE586B1|nr:pyridoxamine 5'-phosphate oxidase family protein [Streptomyces sp. ISL-96]MBT2489994.1 pyridoxamine 5'-phosphate oxidase family protein [Streptomyces sp. ISL-96]